MSKSIIKYLFLLVCLWHNLVFGQAVQTLRSSTADYAILLTMPNCHGEMGSINLKNSDDLVIPSYSFDNHNFKAFDHNIDIEIGDHQLFVVLDGNLDIFDLSIRPNEDISFDYINISPANCQGKNGRLSVAITGSGTSMSGPFTGSGTIIFNTASFGTSMDIAVDAGSYTLSAVLNETVRIDTTIIVPKDNCNVYIPNAIHRFSSSGPNKRFILFFQEGINPLILEYHIYDRWGNLVYTKLNFETKQFTDWWDGSCNGEPCASDVYSYIVRIDFGDGQIEERLGTVHVF